MPGDTLSHRLPSLVLGHLVLADTLPAYREGFLRQTCDGRSASRDARKTASETQLASTTGLTTPSKITALISRF